MQLVHSWAEYLVELANTMQRTATYCNAMQHSVVPTTREDSNKLKGTTPHCNAPPYTATHRDTK